jgi:hypothetical protein
MTTIPPIQPAGAPLVSPVGKPARWRRALVIAVALGLVGFLAAGIGAYAAVSSYRSAQGTVSCTGAWGCIPGLKASKVVEAVKAQGHECAFKNSWTCELWIGPIKFETQLSVSQGYISAVDLRVVRPDGDQASSAIMPYLLWFASLPYAGDAATVSDIKNWLTQQVEARKKTKAKIGDYSYELDAAKPTFISLYFRGAPK